MNKLVSFLTDKEKQNSTSSMELPFYHNCTYEVASDYARKRRISIKHCEVFEKKMIYLFLGRSQYKLMETNQTLALTPIGFVFKPGCDMEIKDLYPFDTGAVTHSFYNPILEPRDIEKVKQSLSIGKDLRLAFQWILLVFGSVDNYLYLKPQSIISESAVRKIVIGDNLPELEAIHGVYTCKWIKADRRRITVEIHVESDLLLTGRNLAGILMPLEFEVNKEFLAIRKDTGAQFIFYDEPNSMFQDSYYDAITQQSIKLSKGNVN